VTVSDWPSGIRSGSFIFHDGAAPALATPANPETVVNATTNATVAAA